MQFVVYVVLLVFTLTCALTGPHDEYLPQVLELWNTTNGDHNQFYTMTDLHDQLVMADKDKDGVVTRTEYVNSVSKDTPDLDAWANAIFDIYDSNFDHRLELADTQALYNKIDTNGDGLVLESEYITFWEHTLNYIVHLPGNSNLGLVG